MSLKFISHRYSPRPGLSARGARPQGASPFRPNAVTSILTDTLGQPMRAARAGRVSNPLPPVITQLTDVEAELNGIMTCDREMIKMPVDKIREANEKVIHWNTRTDAN